MTLNLSATASSALGIVTYNWAYEQVNGATVSGISLSNLSNNVVFTYPNTLAFKGNNATSGIYVFDVQVQANDLGINNCSTSRLITLYFDNAACTISLTPILVTANQ